MRIDEERVAEKIRFIKDNLILVEQLGAYAELEFTSESQVLRRRSRASGFD
jgi:hypothetical protein